MGKIFRPRHYCHMVSWRNEGLMDDDHTSVCTSSPIVEHHVCLALRRAQLYCKLQGQPEATDGHCLWQLPKIPTFLLLVECSVCFDWRLIGCCILTKHWFVFQKFQHFPCQEQRDILGLKGIWRKCKISSRAKVNYETYLITLRRHLKSCFWSVCERQFTHLTFNVTL